MPDILSEFLWRTAQVSDGVGLIRPLSASAGGAPIRLDDGGVPGKVIHANPVDSGGNDILQSILVGNPNPSQVSLWVATVGPSAPAPIERGDMIRIDVPATREGVDVRLFYTPFLLSPGYTYYVSCVLQAGQTPPYLYGFASRYATAPFAGYGGLKTTTQQAIADIAPGNWVTVPLVEGALINPVNVTQDPANNRLSVQAAGVWAVTIHATLTFTKDNADRTISLRLWNETKGVEATSSPFPLYVEQQATGGTWSIPAIPVDIAAGLVNDWIRVEIGDPTDAFAGIQMARGSANVFKIG